MLSRRMVTVVVAALAAGALALQVGCDWLKGSNPGGRLSPNISSLIVPSFVSCTQPNFNVSFRFDDPQGDIASVEVKYQHAGDQATREASFPWPSQYVGMRNGTFDGVVSIFTCQDELGSWTFTVQVADEAGHTSNTLSGEIRLQ